MACDFFVVVTASFHILYVFVIMELGTRRILHHNVTAHPTAEWTLQQFREALPGDHPYRFLIHDRDSIFSRIWTSKWSRWVCACCEPRSGRPPSELRMRALRRDPTPRVPGLSDPDQRTPSQDCYQGVGNPLQSRQASLLTWPWIPGTRPGQRSGQRPQTQIARRVPCGEGFRARRVTS